MFVTSIYFHPSLIFVSEARSLPEQSPLHNSTLMVSSLTCLQILDKGGSEWQLQTL
jgi:hypothetical protein